MGEAITRFFRHSFSRLVAPRRVAVTAFRPEGWIGAQVAGALEELDEIDEDLEERKDIDETSDTMDSGDEAREVDDVDDADRAREERQTIASNTVGLWQVKFLGR